MTTGDTCSHTEAKSSKQSKMFTPWQIAVIVLWVISLYLLYCLVETQRYHFVENLSSYSHRVVYDKLKHCTKSYQFYPGSQEWKALSNNDCNQ